METAISPSTPQKKGPEPRDIESELAFCVSSFAIHKYYPPQQMNAVAAALSDLAQISADSAKQILNQKSDENRARGVTLGQHLSSYALYVPESVEKDFYSEYRQARLNIIRTFSLVPEATQLDLAAVTLFRSAVDGEPYCARWLISSVEIISSLRGNEAVSIFTRLLKPNAVFPFEVCDAYVTAFEKMSPGARQLLINAAKESLNSKTDTPITRLTKSNLLFDFDRAKVASSS